MTAPLDRLSEYRRDFADAKDWHADMPGSDYDTPVGVWLHERSGPLLAVAKAAAEYAALPLPHFKDDYDRSTAARQRLSAALAALSEQA